MSDHRKHPVASVAPDHIHTATGGRRFTRSRGRIVRFDAMQTIRLREIEWDFSNREEAECPAGILALWGAHRNMNMEKHFVTFYAPGSFMAETNTQEIASWDVDEAVRMAGEITMRYGARPYAFKFFTMARGKKDFEPKTTKTGNLYYLGGRPRTLAQVEADNDPKEDVLRSNMRINEIKQVITNDNSWRFTGEFDPDNGDVLLDVTLPPLKKST